MKRQFSETRYSFDTSAFVDSWRRYYPPDIFPTIWERLDSMCQNGAIVASREVKRELEKKDDELLKRLRTHRGLFVELDIFQQQATKELVNRFDGWVDVTSTRNYADPYVVALAKVQGLAVVTYERNGGPANVKIPWVCGQVGVRCLDFLSLLREIGLSI